MLPYHNKIKNELEDLRERLHYINKNINLVYEEGINDWSDEKYLDELYLDHNYCTTKIEEIEILLESIKKTETYKKELSFIAYKILYNPSRVSRLLNENVISFYDSSFEL